MQRGLLTGIILGVAMAIFALQNTVKVQVKLLWWKIDEVPLALILMISIIIGVLITAVFSFIDKQRLRNRLKKLHQRINELEERLVDDTQKQEAGDLISDEGMSIEGEPGHKFFDD